MDREADDPVEDRLVGDVDGTRRRVGVQGRADRALGAWAQQDRDRPPRRPLEQHAQIPLALDDESTAGSGQRGVLQIPVVGEARVLEVPNLDAIHLGIEAQGEERANPSRGARMKPPRRSRKTTRRPSIQGMMDERTRVGSAAVGKHAPTRRGVTGRKARKGDRSHSDHHQSEARPEPVTHPASCSRHSLTATSIARARRTKARALDRPSTISFAAVGVPGVAAGTRPIEGRCDPAGSR